MPLDALQFKSKAQAVYDLLRQRILDFHYEPGQALSIDGLARELGISKIPIREAIKQLEAERFVETELHVGARVAPISVAQAEQIYPIRHVLCDLGMRLAFPRMDEQTLTLLEELQAQMEVATRQRDTATVDRLNRQFHLKMVEASGNAELHQLYRELMHRCSRFRAGVSLPHHRAVEVMTEHRAILAALRARDFDAAIKASDDHSRRSAAEIIDKMRAKEAAQAVV
ncbi:MAG: GntR family transcriptional regulator [Chloroflexi bacterium]|nr:GntR family transcriptional regulator [Chloroflexota bacterium]